MIRSNNPEVCPVPDLSNYPNILNGLSAQDLTAFLCDVINLSRFDDVDPVLRPGPSAFDISPWINSLTTLTDVGDPRLSMGELMKLTLDKYKPLLDIKLSILQEGNQLIGETICDDSGKELYKVKEIAGDNFDPNEITEEITLQSLEKFTYDIWNHRVDRAAQDFANFLRTNFLNKNWNVELITFSTGDLQKIKYGREIPIFYAKVTRTVKDKTEYKYFKYYFDSRQKVADKLSIKLSVKSVDELRTTMIAPSAVQEGVDLMNTFSGPFWPETV